MVSKVAKGVLKVCIPRNKWKGYGFVFFKSKKYLNTFLKRKTVVIQGNALTITPHVEGNKLNKFKKTFNQRRVFVRVLAYEKVVIDLF